jgi:hypothetical protein
LREGVRATNANDGGFFVERNHKPPAKRQSFERRMDAHTLWIESFSTQDDQAKLLIKRERKGQRREGAGSDEVGLVLLFGVREACDGWIRNFDLTPVVGEELEIVTPVEGILAKS